jgi:hypothetical protein
MLYVSNKRMCVVCARVADTPTPTVPSVQRRCTLCHRPIWVSKKAPADWPKVCLPCAKHGGEAMRRSKSEQQPPRVRHQRIH